MNDSQPKPGKNRSFDFFQTLSVLFLIACLAGTVYFFRARYRYTLTSDESSEMVLGNLLAQEGGILSKNWYYSTEIRFLNINIPFAFFFRLTDSWHQVRVLSTVSLYLVMLVTYFAMSRVYRFTRYFALSAAVLFIPFSAVYFYVLTTGIHYIPVIVTAYLILLIGELSIHSSGLRSKVLLGLAFILGILSGISGAKQVFLTYIPLIAAAAAFFADRKSPDGLNWLIYAAVSFLGSIIGYFINTFILTGIYSLYNWGDSVSFTGFSFTRISEVITGILATFGYTTGELFSIALLKNLISAAWVMLTVYAIWYALKNRQNVSGGYVRLAVYTASAFVVFLLFYVFTDAYHHERYNLAFTFFSFPLISLYLQYGNLKKIFSTVLLSVLVLATACSGALYYRSMWYYDTTEELRKAAAFLTENGYRNGYSTFWQSNITTEFSNGELDIWSLFDDHLTNFEVVNDIDQTFHWLQKVSHDNTHPTGKIFILLTADQFEHNKWKDNITDDQIVYRSKAYVILGYDDYDSMVKKLYPGYSYAFGDGEGIENGADINGSRYLKPDGISWGEPHNFWPGKYQLTIQGSGLNNAAVICEDRSREGIEMNPAMTSGEQLQFEFELTEKVYDLRPVVKNDSVQPEDLVRLDTITIFRTDGQ